MKCKLTEVWHRSPEECKCVDRLHLNLNNKYCVCSLGFIVDEEGNATPAYCGDTWKIVDQVVAEIEFRKQCKDYLEEFFEYV